MFMTYSASILKMRLSKFIVKNSIDEQTLLRVYAYYAASHDEKLHYLLADDFFKIKVNEKETFSCLDLPSALSPYFLRYDINRFITTVVPNIVGDCQKISRLIEEKKFIATTSFRYDQESHVNMSEELTISFAILHIKEKFTDLIASGGGPKDKDKEWLYNSYLTEVRKKRFPYIAEIVYFNLLAENTLLLRQDDYLRFFTLRAYAKPFDAMTSLYNKLGLTKQELFWILAEGHALTKKRVDHSIFSGMEDGPEKDSLKNDAFNIIKELPSPATALAIAENTKKRKTRKSKKEIEELLSDSTNVKAIHSSDTPLELSLVFNTFAAEVASMQSKKDECIIMFPSAMFVMKWIDNRFVSNQKATFVIPSEPVLLLLEASYGHDSVYRDSNEWNIRFVLYEDWKRTISEGDGISASFILIFENHIETLEGVGSVRDVGVFITSNLKEQSHDSTIYCLSPEKYIDEQNSILHQFCIQNAFSSMVIEEAVSAPRKGQKEPMTAFSNPRLAKKLFWKACHIENWDGMTRITFLRNDSSILALFGKLGDLWDGNGRMLTQEGAISLTVNLLDKTNSPKLSLRQFCNNPHKVAKKRVKARNKLSFSKEIDFWYTVSEASVYKKGNLPASKKKIKVDVRHIKRPEAEERRNVRGKGLNNIIEGAHADFYINRTLASNEDYLNQYIFTYYPIKKFYEKNENGELVVKRYPREIISKVYQEELKGQDLTLKTFLFIHEEIDNVKLSSSERKIVCLHDILEPLLDIHCSMLTADDFLDAIEETMPDRSVTTHLDILAAIRKLLVGSGNETEGKTIIDSIIYDENKFTRSMSKLRSALGKKHFSLDEFTKLYEMIVRRLDSNPIYYGILIRLFTGLESNIVSSLCWKDYKHDPDYDFNFFIIYRQIPGNGKNIPLPLMMDSDIRRLPLSKTLASHLDKLKKKRGRQEESILSYDPDKDDEEEDDASENYYHDNDDNETATEVSNGQDKGKSATAQKKEPGYTYIVKDSNDSSGLEPVAPSKLDKAVKKLLEEVFGINEEMSFIIPCEDNDEGLEQNLARYRGGFIFRENLRYWLTRYCAFDVDQVSHYLGNTGATTLGRHYLDSNSIPNQYLVASKIWRLDALLQRRGNKPAHRQIIGPKKNILRIKANETNPIDIELNVIPNEEPDELTVTIRCEHSIATCIEVNAQEDENAR